MDEKGSHKVTVRQLSRTEAETKEKNKRQETSQSVSEKRREGKWGKEMEERNEKRG